MHFNGQTILPAIKKMKDFERVLDSHWEHIVLLDTHLAQLSAVIKEADKHGKKVLLHADMVQGLRTDTAASQFLCQVVHPYAIISTRGDMLETAKKNRVVAIQRMFLIDTLALETSCKLAEKVRPDYIEILPGVVPDYIRTVSERTGIPVVAGGLIRTDTDIQQAIAAGAVAITTSRSSLWTR